MTGKNELAPCFCAKNDKKKCIVISMTKTCKNWFIIQKKICLATNLQGSAQPCIQGLHQLGLASHTQPTQPIIFVSHSQYKP